MLREDPRQTQVCEKDLGWKQVIMKRGMYGKGLSEKF